MRLRVCLVIGLIATIGLAGCFEEGDLVPVQGADTGGDGGNVTTDPGDQTGGDVDDVDGNSTVDDNVTNTPPVANLTADVLNGTAPLNVTFTIDGTDADGDNLTWSLDADGDGVPDAEGTDLPASFPFTYAEVGNFTAQLTVADTEASSNATLIIVVLDAVPAGFEPWTEAGDATASCPGCIVMSEASLTPKCVGLATATNELDCVFFELPAGAEGRIATLGADGFDGDWVEYGFLTACAADAEVLLAGAGYGPSPMAVPAGATCVVLADSVFVGTAFVITIA